MIVTSTNQMFGSIVDSTFQIPYCPRERSKSLLIWDWLKDGMIQDFLHLRDLEDVDTHLQ